MDVDDAVVRLDSIKGEDPFQNHTEADIILLRVLCSNEETKKVVDAWVRLRDRILRTNINHYTFNVLP